MSAIDISRRYDLMQLVQELRLAARTVRSQTIAERRATCGLLTEFVRERLEPHALHDEQGLEALVGWTDALELANPADPDELQELLYGIDALIRVHLWRETGMPLEPPEPRGKGDV